MNDNEIFFFFQGLFFNFIFIFNFNHFVSKENQREKIICENHHKTNTEIKENFQILFFLLGILITLFYSVWPSHVQTIFLQYRLLAFDPNLRID